MVEFHEILLPSHQASLSQGNDLATQHQNPQRSFAHAVVDVEGALLNVISVRFIAGRAKNDTFEENLRWGRYLFSTQLKEVRVFREYLLQLEVPIIFGGDLNAPPSSKTIRYLSSVASDAYSARHLWGGFTFRTDRPSRRLDYLFSMGDVAPLIAKRLDIVVSDHFPVYGDFLIAAQPVRGDLAFGTDRESN